MNWKVLLLFILIFMTGCGKKDFPDYSNDQELPQYEEEDAVYTLSSRSLSSARVKGTLWIKGDQFYTLIVLKNGSKNTRHQQFIHQGSRCPDQRDDTNQDGKIDFNEVIKASGKILIPLDRNLVGQAEGGEWFPVTNDNGTYNYSRATFFSKMMRDLKELDQNTFDVMGKLGKDEGLNLEDRVLMIFGNDRDPWAPVSCSRIIRDYSNSTESL